MAGVAGSLVHYAERGRVPRLDTIERIAIALGVSSCWLAFGDEGSAPVRQQLPRPGRPLLLRPLTAREATPNYGSIGARLFAMRERRGLSRRALGKAAETSGTSILNIEDGRTIPRLDMVERLATALDVPPCWLAFGVPTTTPA
jgi:transcriptional regulator with XRE-family HTH domain